MSNPYLALVGSFLHSRDDVRAEWSLEASEDGVRVRPFLLFWMDFHKSTHGETSCHPIVNLVRMLGCPESVLKVQRALECFSVSLAVGVPTDLTSNQFRLIIHHEIGGVSAIESFKWNDNEADHSSYSFNLFKNEASLYSLPQIHSQIKPIFKRFLNDEKLIEKSGFWYQYRDHTIREVYLTYPWHPPLKIIFNLLNGFIHKNHINELAQIRDFNFRHAGFSSLCTDRATITFYFTASLSGSWPKSFEETRECVIENGKELNQRLNGYFNLTK